MFWLSYECFFISCDAFFAKKMPGRVNSIEAAPADFLFGLALILATLQLLLPLNAERFSLKLLSCIPISLLILFIFLDWFSARTSAKSEGGF